MRGRKAQNKRLDKVGRDLFEASILTDAEIEKIVCSSHLFQSVRERIGSQKAVTRTGQVYRWRWSWPVSAAAFGILMLVLCTAVGLSIYVRKPLTAVKGSVHSRPDLVVSPYDPQIAIPTIEKPVNAYQPVPQHAVFKTHSRTSIRTRQTPTEEVSEFYPLSAGGDENEDGGQLVRVKLPRSALIAMGVDPPFETDSAKIKADLLVGSDGVMQAVRFVK